MSGFPLAIFQEVHEPRAAELRQLGSVLKSEFGLEFGIEELAELEEMVPRDPEVDAVRWIADAATAVAERVTEVSKFSALEGELLKRWVRMRWNWTPTDRELQMLIKLASGGEKHGAHLPRVTLELFRLLRTRGDFAPANIEQLVSLIRHLQFDTTPILLFEPASGSDEAVSLDEVPNEEDASDPEPRLSARLRRILGFGKRKQKFR